MSLLSAYLPRSHVFLWIWWVSWNIHQHCFPFHGPQRNTACSELFTPDSVGVVIKINSHCLFMVTWTGFLCDFFSLSIFFQRMPEKFSFFKLIMKCLFPCSTFWWKFTPGSLNKYYVCSQIWAYRPHVIKDLVFQSLQASRVEDK